MDNIKLIKMLIAKTDDETELVELNKQLDDAIRAEAKAEARKELKAEMDAAAEKAEVEKAKAESTMAKIPEPTAEPAIKVGTPALYKGYGMKAAIGTLQHSKDVSPIFRARAKEDPEGAESVVKFFIDKLAAAPRMGAEEAMSKGMTEGTTTAGGYLTPTEQPSEVLSYIRDVSIAMSDARVVNVASDSWEVPRENAKVSVVYTDEASDATETTPSFANVTMTPKRLDAYTKVTNELIADDAKASGGIAGLLASQFMEAIGQKVDSTVFIGTGSPASGVFLSAGVSTVFSTGSSNFSELLESDLRAIIAKIRPNRRANAKWYASTSVLWNYIRGLKDSDGRPLYYETITGLDPTPRLLGKPIREGNDDIMPSTSAASTGFIVFGDLAGFVIGQRLADMQLFVDPYSLARSYQTQFLSFTRWGYAHALPNYYGRIVTAS